MSYNISSSLSDLLHSAWHFLSPFMLLKMALFHSFSWYPWNFPGGSVVKNLPASTGDPGLIPGLGRSPGEGTGYPLQYSCLEKPMDRGAWQATYSSRSCKELDMTEWPILLLPSPPVINRVTQQSPVSRCFGLSQWWQWWASPSLYWCDSLTSRLEAASPFLHIYFQTL